jgi:hypothetical protein
MEDSCEHGNKTSGGGKEDFFTSWATIPNKDSAPWSKLQKIISVFIL